MTADVQEYKDVYADSYHRGFFANYVKGMDPLKCG